MSRTDPSDRSVMFRFFIAHSDAETISGAFIKILLTSDTGDGSPWLNVDVLLQHPCQSKKKTVSFYNAQTKSYSIDYSKLTINLHDEKFHTAYFILNNNYKGYPCFAIDGVYFNRELPTGNLYLTNLRVRGDKNNTVIANALTIKNLGISSKLPSLLNFQMVPTDFTEFEGYYT
ncbi:hypothetical protein, partial [Commensalibacter communis]